MVAARFAGVAIHESSPMFELVKGVVAGFVPVLGGNTPSSLLPDRRRADRYG
jgi:hypothetical protein